MLFKNATTWGLVISCGLIAWHSQSNQRSAPDDLEQRVTRLENVVFATSKLAVFDAERNLKIARRNLVESERLYLRGLIADYQLSADRFAVDRAKRELKLANADDEAFRLATEIDVMQAQQNLNFAEQQLEHSERMANRGYSSQTEIENWRREVQRAKLQLETAQQRLDAVEK